MSARLRCKIAFSRAFRVLWIEPANRLTIPQWLLMKKTIDNATERAHVWVHNNKSSVRMKNARNFFHGFARIFEMVKHIKQYNIIKRIVWRLNSISALSPI